MSPLVIVNPMQMSFASYQTNIHQKYTTCTGTRRSDKKVRTFRTVVYLRPEAVFVNVSGAQESIPMNRFRGSIKGLQIRVLTNLGFLEQRHNTQRV